jgi:hypothetical protein
MGFWLSFSACHCLPGKLSWQGCEVGTVSWSRRGVYLSNN